MAKLNDSDSDSDSGSYDDSDDDSDDERSSEISEDHDPSLDIMDKAEIVAIAKKMLAKPKLREELVSNAYNRCVPSCGSLKRNVSTCKTHVHIGSSRIHFLDFL